VAAISSAPSRRLGWLRWLLEVDKPVPPRDDAAIAAEADKNYRWNFAVNLLDGAWFWFGLSFISATTLLPLFVTKISTNPLWIALLAVLTQAAWSLPQLIAAGPTERVARKKAIIVNLGFFTERVPLFVLPLAALLAVQQPMLALLLFFVGYAWHGFGAGAVAPAWSDLIASCFPVDKRGWFFGLTAFIGTGLGAVGALGSSWLLETYPYPLNFALNFLIAAVAILISWGFLALAREPVRPLPVHIEPPPSSSKKIEQVVRTDTNYRNFLVARLLGSLGRMGAGFITVAVMLHWAPPDATVGLFTVALLLGQTLGTLAAGLVADRWGHKMSLTIGMVVNAASFALAWLAQDTLWFYPVFLLNGAANGMLIVSSVLSVMEFSAPEDRPTYIGLGNTVTGIGSAIAPLIGGLLAVISYDFLFVASAVVSIVGVVVLAVFVREPRGVVG
jgi:MFS family permease